MLKIFSLVILTFTFSCKPRQNSAELSEQKSGNKSLLTMDFGSPNGGLINSQPAIDVKKVEDIKRAIQNEHLSFVNRDRWVRKEMIRMAKETTTADFLKWRLTGHKMHGSFSKEEVDSLEEELDLMWRTVKTIKFNHIKLASAVSGENVENVSPEVMLPYYIKLRAVNNFVTSELQRDVTDVYWTDAGNFINKNYDRAAQWLDSSKDELTAYVNFALESAFPRSQKVFDENRRRVLEATVVQLRELDDADARAKETEENAKLFPSSIPDLKDAMVAAQLQATESQRKTLLGVYQSLTGKPYKGKGSKPSNKSSEKKSGLGLVDDAEESNDDAPVDAPIDELTLVDVRQGDYSPLMGIQFAESGGYGGYSGFWVSPGPTQGIAGTIAVLKGKNHRVNQQGNLDSWRYEPNSVPGMGLDAGSYCKRALHVSGRWITGIGAGLTFVSGSWLSYGFTSPNVTSLFSLLLGTTVGVGAEAAFMALAPGYKVSVALTPKRLLIEYGPLLGLGGGYYAGVGADIIYEFDPPACPENHQDKILQK